MIARRAAVAEAVGEIAGPLALEQEPRDEGERQQERTPCEQRETAGEGEGERDEPGRAARLRERDRIREAHEELRHEHQREHRDRPAEHEGAPAAARGEAGERHHRERGNRDRAGPARHLGGEPEVVHRGDDELVAVVGKRLRLERRRSG